MSIDEAVKYITSKLGSIGAEPLPPVPAQAPRTTEDAVIWLQIKLYPESRGYVVLRPYSDSDDDCALLKHHLWSYCRRDEFAVFSVGWRVHHGLHFDDKAEAMIRDEHDDKLFEIAVSVERNPTIANMLRGLSKQRSKKVELFTVRTVSFERKEPRHIDQVLHVDNIQHFVNRGGQAYRLGYAQETFMSKEDAVAHAAQRVDPKLANNKIVEMAQPLETYHGVLLGALLHKDRTLYSMVIVVKVGVSVDSRMEVYDL